MSAVQVFRASADQYFAAQAARSGKAFPFLRSWRGSELLPHELARVMHVARWRASWQSMPVGSRVNEIALFATTARAVGWRLQSPEHDRFAPLGLKALIDTESEDFLAFFPRERRPTDNSLVVIRDARRANMERSGALARTLIVERWESLPHQRAFPDLPRPAGQIAKALLSPLHGNLPLAQAVELAMLGACAGAGRPAGISLASYSGTRNDRTTQLLLEMLLHPSLRTVRPPERAEAGVWRTAGDGISLHYGCGSVVAGPKVESRALIGRNDLRRALRSRRTSIHERSTISALSDIESDFACYTDLFHGSSVVEISRPTSLTAETDAGLLAKAVREVSEETLLVTLSARDFNPEDRVGPLAGPQIRDRLRRDFDAQIDSRIIRRVDELAVDEFLHVMTTNARHLAYAVARSRGRTAVDESDVRRAVGVVRDCFSLVARSPQFQARLAEIESSRAAKRRTVIVSACADPRGTGAHDLWATVDVCGLFDGYDDFVVVLEMLRHRGSIYEPRPGYYART